MKKQARGEGVIMTKSEVKNQWLAALRSGEYTQGIGRLRRLGEKYCCLGVLCDLHAKAGLGMWESSAHTVTGKFKYVYRANSQPDTFTGVAPLDVAEWAGLSTDLQADLVRCNDIDRLSFHEIANIVEKRL